DASCRIYMMSIGRMYSFFFSSRRRHTRFSRDWSSDVCSSDLRPPALGAKRVIWTHERLWFLSHQAQAVDVLPVYVKGRAAARARSEERRVGKECRSGRSPSQYKKKN